MIQSINSSKKYVLDGFISNLYEWVDSFKLRNTSNQFSVVRGKNKPSLYGLCDMVYNLVTQTLGGRIKCTSLPGKGTQFKINIPTSQ